MAPAKLSDEPAVSWSGRVPPEPLRMYSDDDARLPVRLSKVLRDRIDSLSETVLTGQLSEREYRSVTGQIQGLREALTEAERIAIELSGN